jgi:hypothetical protein
MPSFPSLLRKPKHCECKLHEAYTAVSCWFWSSGRCPTSTLLPLCEPVSNIDTQLCEAVPVSTHRCVNLCPVSTHRCVNLCPISTRSCVKLCQNQHTAVWTCAQYQHTAVWTCAQYRYIAVWTCAQYRYTAVWTCAQHRHTYRCVNLKSDIKLQVPMRQRYQGGEDADVGLQPWRRR